MSVEKVDYLYLDIIYTTFFPKTSHQIFATSICISADLKAEILAN